jgi:hypothetical protein
MKPARRSVIECKFWEYTAMSILFFFAALSIITQFKDWSLTRDIIISCAATVGISWSIWVVRTFRNILEWWADLQNTMSEVSTLLAETKEELNEIKSSIKQ